MTLGTVPATAADTADDRDRGREHPVRAVDLDQDRRWPLPGSDRTAVSSADGWTKIRFGGGYRLHRQPLPDHRAGSRRRATVSGTRVTTTTVNLRKGPGLSYDILRVVPDGHLR